MWRPFSHFHISQFSHLLTLIQVVLVVHSPPSVLQKKNLQSVAFFRKKIVPLSPRFDANGPVA